ncbi:type II toxin-antitoxin system RelE/ParE family toxin [Pelobium manganitolerans]|uniref:type II toxin-antitoxin system RelE/ParE family toxin n=1 Tax=Pelobium manganitolerans TaxID=1842495 RepID=UPI000E71675B
MKSGYKIRWTSHALSELKHTINYLRLNFSERELKRLASEIERTLDLITENPLMFPHVKIKNVHRAVILRFNTLYYRIHNEEIQIISFFSNRKNPEKRKF